VTKTAARTSPTTIRSEYNSALPAWTGGQPCALEADPTHDEGVGDGKTDNGVADGVTDGVGDGVTNDAADSVADGEGAVAVT
jgi:hypothetical protein